jgi:hypothetical protein
MSILNDLEKTLDNGTNYASRNKIFDVLFDDMVKAMSNESSITGISYQGHHFPIQGTSNANGGYSLFMGKDSYLRHLIRKAKQSFSMVRLYELYDHFGLSDNEIKLFLESDYIHIYQTEYRAYDMEYGTSIDFNSDMDLLFQYLENPEIITQSYYNYCYSQKVDNRRDTPIYNIYGHSSSDYHYFARSFRKQILSLNVIVNDRFWGEFSEYIRNKPLEWYV